MQARSSLYITKANAPEIYTTFGNNREQIFRLEGCHLYNRRNFSFGSLPTNLAGMSFLYFSQSVDQDEASGKAKEYERLLRAFAGGMARSFKGAGTDGYSEGFCQQVNQICQNEKEPISKLAEGSYHSQE